MKFRQVFLQSLKLPSKKATFSLNRVSMDIAIIYMFILLILVSIPAFIDRIVENSGVSAELNIAFLIIYFFIFYYLPMAIFVCIGISLIAYIGLGLAKLMERKLQFPLLWKMSVFIATIPFIIYTIIALLFPVDDMLLGAFFVYILIMLFFIISIYPKRRK
ncbi:hypothetical protein OPHB3_1870 [Oceanobacillus picturae]|jgi:Protein of unknown function (DUF1189)|uniref:DUF1189 domain-containing protein n=1 Tax=Oceanobacillus picturae TaxID=171693 RepID=W9AH74_9BACI|nr:DUF1189 family protein [Oceanobacillus picturae]GAQ17933.1 hypothetical protein OPHB3_1870 [Oceanobacillus picturae]CDO04833.1 hypothetical protein BN988_03400 [Oceanobacillus picturae]